MHPPYLFPFSLPCTVLYTHTQVIKLSRPGQGVRLQTNFSIMVQIHSAVPNIVLVNKISFQPQQHGGYQAQPEGYYPPLEQQQTVPPAFPIDHPPPYLGPPASYQDSFRNKQAT